MYFNYDFRQLPMSSMMPGQTPGTMPSQTSGMMPTQQMGTTSPTQPMVSPGGTDLGPSGSVEQDINYTQGWLKTQIGRRVQITFLLGTDSIQDRSGTLVSVGISYVILREAETDDLLLCDIYSIKFVRVYL